MELFVNGQSSGVQQNLREDPKRENSIDWKAVPLGQGGKLTVVARSKGRDVAHLQLETTG